MGLNLLASMHENLKIVITHFLCIKIIKFDEKCLLQSQEHR
jgi:hypothetical protein